MHRLATQRRLPTLTCKLRLLADARRGDAEALGALFIDVQEKAIRVACRFLRSIDDAEDVVQTAYIKAMDGIRYFRGESRFDTWFLSIVLNEARMLRRRTDFKRTQYTDMLLFHEAEAIKKGLCTDLPSAEDELIQEQLLATLRLAMERLPQPLREVMQLEVHELLSCASTSSALGISIAAVKSRRLRARQELLRRLVPLLRRSATRPGREAHV